MTDQQVRPGHEATARTRNDETAFQELYASMSPSVFQFAARRLTAEQAKDVVHDTFEIVWRKRRHLPPDRNAWPAWVIGIARNKIRQEAARQRRRTLMPWPARSQPQADDMTTEGIADSVLDSLASRDIYRRLSTDERELFDLAHLRTLSPRDGAAVLGISISAYTTRVSRLRTRIVSLTTEPAGPDE